MKQYAELFPLHAAARKGDAKSVANLLEAKANANELDRYNTAPLHIAIARHDAESVGKLLQAKANPDIWDENSRTPLYVAIGRKFNFFRLTLGKQFDAIFKTINA